MRNTLSYSQYRLFKLVNTDCLSERLTSVFMYITCYSIKSHPTLLSSGTSEIYICWMVSSLEVWILGWVGILGFLGALSRAHLTPSVLLFQFSFFLHRTTVLKFNIQFSPLARITWFFQMLLSKNWHVFFITSRSQKM